MSQIQYTCPECGGKFDADDAPCGFAGICPLCGEWIELEHPLANTVHSSVSSVEIPRVVPKKLLCHAFRKEVDIFAPEESLPVCTETCMKGGVCDDRWCIWSLGVAMGLEVQSTTSGEDLWHLRDMIFFHTMRPIDWCESAWDPSKDSLPVASIGTIFTKRDSDTGNTHVIQRVIEEAVSESVNAGQLKFLELGSLDFPPDGREPCETPEIARWAQKCIQVYPDLLFWMGPVTMVWFLPCVRPGNVRRERKGTLALQLDESDIAELIEMGRSAVLLRLRSRSAPDDFISRLWLSSIHKLSWALSNGRPPINYMGRR